MPTFSLSQNTTRWTFGQGNSTIFVEQRKVTIIRTNYFQKFAADDARREHQPPDKSNILDRKGRIIGSRITQPVYHGTGAAFKRFNLKNSTQGLIWFTSDRDSIVRGESGAAGQGYILELQVDIKNPAGWKEYENLMLAQLKSEGYDGAILPSENGQFDGFVFKPSQVKIMKRESLNNPKTDKRDNIAVTNMATKVASDVFQVAKNLDGRTLIFFDTETTGLKASVSHSQITEIAALAMDDKGAMIDRFAHTLHLTDRTKAQMESELGKPEDPKNWGVKKTLDYNKYDPAKADIAEEDVIRQFGDWVEKQQNPLLVAHNASFDMSFINIARKRYRMAPISCQVLDFFKFSKLFLEPSIISLNRAGVPEAQAIHQKLWDTNKNRLRFNQGDLGKAFGVPTPASHVAINDAIQLSQLVSKVLVFIDSVKQHFGPDSAKDFGTAYVKWKTRKQRHREEAKRTGRS